MASIFALLDKLFSIGGGDDAISKSIVEERAEALRSRRFVIDKTWDFYSGNTVKHLAPNEAESAKRWASRPKVTHNSTRPIMDRKSTLVYKGQIKRRVAVNGDFFAAVWRLNQIDAFMASVDLNALATGIVAIRPVVDVDPETGKDIIRYRQYTGDQIVIDLDPETGEVAVLSLVYAYYDTETGRTQTVVQSWRAGSDKVVTLRGGKKIIEDNPYNGQIPFAFAREQRDDQDPHGMLTMIDVVNQNSALNTMLTDLAWLVKTQCHSQLVARGANSNQVGATGAGTVSFLMDTNASLEYVTPSPKVTEMLEVIRELKRQIPESAGVPAAALNPEAAESGRAQLTQWGPLLDYREAKIVDYKGIEADLARVTAMVADTHGIATFKNPAAIGFSIDYDESPWPWANDVIYEREERDMMAGLVSIVDAARRRNPDLSEEQAIALLDKNIELNRRYGVLGASQPATQSIGDVLGEVGI